MAGEIHAGWRRRRRNEEELNLEKKAKKMYRLWLRMMDLMNLCFMEGCSGCQALVSGTEAHLEACRERKNNALESTDEGRVRRKRQLEKENEALPSTWRRSSECRTRRGSARRRVWDEENHKNELECSLIGSAEKKKPKVMLERGVGERRGLKRGGEG